MNILRKYWPDLGLLAAVVTVIGIAVNHRFMSELSILLWLNLVAILVHQFEEYRWPGYFGGLFNVILFRSEQPRHYPLNPQSAMIINLLIAYVFYLLPLLFPHVIWLALGPILMGFFQLIWHGGFANLKAKTWYNPGLFAALTLHLPIGGWYIHSIIEQGLIDPIDWILGSAYFAAAVYLLIIKGNLWLKDPHSPFDFSDKQMGPYLRR
ncbi:HXXEE domain-containing protein [Saccharibacillus sp. O16]|nr:HXXEE domain-containing protein [Saccharibacillus sp. O16]